MNLLFVKIRRQDYNLQKGTEIKLRLMLDFKFYELMR